MVAMNSIITRTGVCYITAGIQHNIFVRQQLKMSLKKFLQSGGVRVKAHNDHMAVEAGQPLTVEQKAWIRKALKEHDYFSVVVSIGGQYAAKERFRPIRSL